MFCKSKFSTMWFSVMIVLMLFLIGCAQPTPTPTPKPTPTPTPRPLATATPTPKPTPTPIKGEGQVVVYGMGIWEQLTRDLWIPKFEKDTGCKVTYFGGISSAILARIKAEAGKPTVDATDLNVTGSLEAKMMGLLQKNNREILTNLKSVLPKLLEPDDVGIPWVIQIGAVMGVRHDKLKANNLPMPQSWLDVANPVYKGKVGLATIQTTTMQEWVLHVATALGGSQNDYGRAFDWMDTKLKPNVLAVAGLAEWQKLLEEGSIWVGVGTSARVAQLYASGAPVTMVIPKEGTGADYMGWQATKNAANPICAQLWMNHMISRDVQDAVAEKIIMGPVRSDASVSDKVKPVVWTPSDYEKKVDVNRDALVKNLPDIIDRWNRVWGK
ncbi:MAG: extracellular solute-binding protein [Chloroflexi bacterium]|nr:extracellular solute-binding protein [Chloroflexota bacterium]